jgi:general secretion pathway protein J
MRGRDDCGFTLVELLVGLGLMALISVLLFGGFRFGLRVWEAGDDRITATNEIEMAQHLLRQQIAESQPVVLAPELERAPVLFRGDAGGLLFVAPLPAHHGVGGFYLFSLAADRAQKDHQLVLRWRRFRSDKVDATAFDPKDRSVLVNGVGSIEIRYFGRPTANAPARWLESWDGAHGLPQLVRVRILFPRGDGRQWPELVVAPRLWTLPS